MNKRRETSEIIDKNLPLVNLIVLRGMLAGQQVRVLKDDGCNTNVISKEFFAKNANLLTVSRTNTCISHSKQGITEQSTHLIRNATLHLGEHAYTSNWAVADSRYDVMLGMPWHAEVNPKIFYAKRELRFKGKMLPLDAEHSSGKVSIANLAVKKFRSLLKHKPTENFQVFMLANVKATPIEKEAPNDSTKMSHDESRLQALLQKYENVFRDELPERLPPERAVDHNIELLE